MDLSPLWISLKIAATATAFTVILGVICARLVMGLRRGQAVIDGLLSLPLVLPPTVVGYYLLVFVGHNSVVGKVLSTAGIRLVFTWQGGVLAAMVVSFPVMYRAARGALSQVDRNLVFAARTLGLSEARIFFKILLPEAAPGLFAAAVLSFARALGEFGATIMVAGNLPGKTRTMSVAIYSAMQAGDRALAGKWALMILAVSFTVLLGMNLIQAYGEKKVQGGGQI